MDSTGTEWKIPFNKPSLIGNELEFIAEAISLGHISGNGEFGRRAESRISGLIGTQASLLTTNCTHALELSSRILKLGPGDEVIIPAYTFVSTASAFAMSGARPVFVDVDDQTLNLDVEAASAALSERTRAICTVHYAGIASRIDEIAALASRSGVDLIEDNAHGFGGTYKGKPLGSYGRLATLSFHETKNITCGEGGAILLNDRSDLSLAEILREKGTDRTRFLRGQVDKYSWVELGSSWVPSEILAAYLLAQLDKFDLIQEKRMAIWKRYETELAAWMTRIGVRGPVVSEFASHTAHMFFVRFSDIGERDRFIAHMRSRGVSAVFHYQALNASAVGLSFGGSKGQCPNAENAAQTLVRLPLFYDLSQSELDWVIESAIAFS